MKSLDFYIPRVRDLATVLSMLAPPRHPDGPDTPGAPPGLLLCAGPGTGLSSFLYTELLASQYARQRNAFYESLHTVGAEGDPHAVEALIAVAEDAAATDKVGLLILDQLHMLPKQDQGRVLCALDQAVATRGGPDQLQYVAAAGSATPPAGLDAACAVHVLPPLGHDFTFGLALYLGEGSGLVLDPAAIDSVFQACSFKPDRLKAALRELVQGGHPDLESAAAAIGIVIPDVV